MKAALVSVSMFTLLLAGVAAGGQMVGPRVSAENAPLTLGNREIIVFRAPMIGVGPRDREARAGQRLADALERNDSPAITTQVTEAGTAVLLDGRGVFLIGKGDVDTFAGETLASTTALALKNLNEAIAEWREQRSPRQLALAAALTIIVTSVLAFTLRGILLLVRGFEKRVTELIASHTQRFNVGGVSLLDPAQLLVFVRGAVRLLAWLLTFGAIYVWAVYVLEQFPYTRPWGERLEDHLVGFAARLLTSIVDALPGIAVCLVIFLIARLVVRTAAVFFDRVQGSGRGVGWLDSETVVPTRRLFAAIVWLFALALAFPHLPGAETDAFKGISVLVGLMISIGGSSVVAQGASGLILTYSRAFRTGEYVRIGDTEGTVVDIGMFSTRVRTGLGEEILLPNSTIMAGASKNYSRAAPGTKFMLETVVTIGYDTPWRQVHAMLIDAARRTERIVPEPAPFVRQTALSDFYVEYHVVAYSDVELPVLPSEVLSRLHENIQDVFNEHGVQIMSPNYEGDPAEPKIVPKEKWFPPPTSAAENDRRAAGPNLRLRE